MRVALALPPSVAGRLAKSARRHGHEVVLSATDSFELVAGLDASRPELAIVTSAPSTLSAGVLAQCDARGIRMLAIVDSDAERRHAREVGLFETLPAGAEWVEIDAALGGVVVEADPREEPRGSVIAVWGPAGSPGRTSVAIGIAVELAAAGFSVALADADPHSASVAPTLGMLDEAPGFAAACRLAATDSLTHAELERIGQRYTGPGATFWVLTGIGQPSRWPELSTQRVASVITQCRSWVDFTVIDTGFSIENDEEISSDLMDSLNVGIDGIDRMAHSHAQNDEKGPMRPRIGAYARISLDTQGEGLGVARQSLDNQTQAERRGWDIVESYTDNNLSAYKRAVVRPGFERLLNALENGVIDGFVAYDIDRLWRQPSDLERVIRIYEDKPYLVFATVQGDIDLSTSQGRTMARIMVALANKSSADTSRRVKRKIVEQAEAGEPHWSRRPYGYTLEKTLDPVEAHVVRQMGEWFIQGFSYREIAWRLNEQDILTRAGSTWYVGTIRQFMKAERFAAIRLHGDKVIDGTWPAIFSKEEWAEIQLEVMTRKERYSSRPKPKKYLLTGILRCSCGGYLRGMTKRDAPERPLRRTYQCPTSSETERRMKTCAAMCVDADSLEHFLRETILKRLEDPELFHVVGRNSTDRDRIAELRQEDLDIKARRDVLLDDYADGLLNRDDLKRTQDRLSARKADVDTELDKLQRAQFNVSLNAGESVREAWMDRPDGWRRSLVDLVINEVVVSKSSRKPYYVFDGRRSRFDIQRIEIDWKGSAQTL